MPDKLSLVLSYGGRIAELYAALPKDLSRAILALTSNDNHSNKLGLKLTPEIKKDLITHPVSEILFDGAMYELMIFVPDDIRQEERLFLVQKHTKGKMISTEEYLSRPSMQE